ncbi:MAG: hypothetical protein JO219_08110 [Candidatus Eremiobacteraeota bacterium]|nr:hypothetical protein [Candidatus Eremiobacteraeota bacterium]MBV8367237.1 hypothetical protein [Candidatus Eremiobacteraeota bacterium]
MPIQAQNSSGQTGVAVLTPMTDNKTKVDVSVSGEPSGASEPAHVHLGTCNKLNVAPKYPLNPVVNGKSSTVLDLPISQLETTPMAINLHQSAANIGTYVACGNIVSVTAPTSPAPASPPGMAPSPG